MNDQDKAAARRALETKQLTIEQVEEIRAEVDRSGRSFEEVARSRGLAAAAAPPSPPAPPAPPARAVVPPPRRKIPLLYEILIVVTLLIMLGVPVSIWRLIQTSRKDVELALETEQSNLEADRKAGQARAGYQRSLVEARETRAREALQKARAAMVRAESRLSAGPAAPDVTLALNEAFIGYNTYLDVLPDDADVRVERARTHELRRNYDLAIADLERVMELRPDSARTCKDKITQLRLFIARPPK
jgi:hypothetical protein